MVSKPTARISAAGIYKNPANRDKLHINQPTNSKENNPNPNSWNNLLNKNLKFFSPA